MTQSTARVILSVLSRHGAALLFTCATLLVVLQLDGQLLGNGAGVVFGVAHGEGVLSGREVGVRLDLRMRDNDV